jgi:hypothetical protein
MHQPLHLRIFLSSPGDVAEERELARKLIKEELAVEPFIKGKATLEAVSYDDPYARVGMSSHKPPQDSLKKDLPLPSECDIVVVIFWTRMGTPLQKELKKENGEPYASGTEWEYEDARRAAKIHDRPKVLLYRRNHRPIIPSRQFRLVKEFFNRFANPDGSLSGWYDTYSKPAEFKELLRQHLTQEIAKRLEEEAVPWLADELRSYKPDVFDDIQEPTSFVGRSDKIDQIHKHFFPEKAADPEKARKAPPPSKLRRVLLWAGPGFGKTSLARKYAHERRGYFHKAHGVLAEKKELLLEQVKSLYSTKEDRSLQKIDKEAEAVDRKKLQSYFGDTKQPCLMIFDNVDRATQKTVDDIVSSLPANVRVICTARFKWGDKDGVELIQVDKLDVTDAVALLRQASEKGAEGDPRGELDGSGRLANTLQYWPLALDYAGRACKHGRSFASYEEELGAELKERPPIEHDYVKQVDGEEAAPSIREAIVTLSLGHAKKLACANLKTEQDKKLAAENVGRLADFLSYCYPDAIPRSLFTKAIDGERSINAALKALEDVGLVRSIQTDDKRDEFCLSMHRLVQKVVRVDADESGRSAAIIDKLAPFLYEQLGDKKSTGIDLRFKKYFPHLLQALPELDAPDFRGNKVSDILENVAELIIISLRRYESEEAYPESLPGLLGCFYKVDALEDPLDFILDERLKDRPREDWRGFRDKCLEQQNYVLRYALADALAGRLSDDGAIYNPGELTELLSHPEKLNHFELGGYALKSYYSDPGNYEKIDCGELSLLARHPCYPGRSILGDLLLNLVYQQHDVRRLLPPDEQQNSRFWEPIWDFVAHDVNAIRAAEYRNRNETPPDREDQEVKAEYAYLLQLVEWQDHLLKRFAGDDFFEHILTGYFSTGANDEWKKSTSKFENLSISDELLPLLRLLYGHPLWSVAESAASVLAALLSGAKGDAAKVGAYTSVIEQLLARELPWRVRYGALETAYLIHLDEETKHQTFFKGVRLHYNDPVSKIRGLCAEDLFSIMLNSSDQQRVAYEGEFESVIERWLVDDDCWVLEHVYRYFSSLQKRADKEKKNAPFPPSASIERFKNSEQSPLVDGLGEWWRKDRREFLEYIERKKEARHLAS